MKQLTSTKMIYFVDESGDPNFLGKENMWVALEKAKTHFTILYAVWHSILSPILTRSHAAAPRLDVRPS